jgi:hypothetical protein
MTTSKVPGLSGIDKLRRMSGELAGLSEDFVTRYTLRELEALWDAWQGVPVKPDQWTSRQVERAVFFRETPRWVDGAPTWPIDSHEQAAIMEAATYTAQRVFREAHNPAALFEQSPWAVLRGPELEQARAAWNGSFGAALRALRNGTVFPEPQAPATPAEGVKAKIDEATGFIAAGEWIQVGMSLAFANVLLNDVEDADSRRTLQEALHETARAGTAKLVKATARR